MSKQTAVDWLIKQVEDYIGLIPLDIIEQAKAMEREQIEEAFKHGNLPTFLGQVLSAKEYYNETYKGGEQ